MIPSICPRNRNISRMPKCEPLPTTCSLPAKSYLKDVEKLHLKIRRNINGSAPEQQLLEDLVYRAPGDWEKQQLGKILGEDLSNVNLTPATSRTALPSCAARFRCGRRRAID